MALKRVGKDIMVGRCAAKVYRDPEYNEYVVKFTPPPKRPAPGSDGFYHTDHKDDAIETAKAELRRMNERGLCG